MRNGFLSIFPSEGPIHIVVSQESAMYRPEMEWLADRIGPRAGVHGADWDPHRATGSVYRFFELFDVANVPCAKSLVSEAETGRLWLTPPPKAYLEEKAWMALLWNPHLTEFWRRLLGTRYLKYLRNRIPRTWILDPRPVPPHTGIPGLELPGWEALKLFSQKQRALILKRSGFAPDAWGARSVILGSDIPASQWAAVIDRALNQWPESLWILQDYHKPCRIPFRWVDLESGQIHEAEGRVRLCPYYFVSENTEEAPVSCGGVLATICPKDKKILHGMSEAVMAPCSW